MNNYYFEYWKMAYNENWCDLSTLRGVVKTNDNPYGYINEYEYEAIVGKPFNTATVEDNKEDASNNVSSDNENKEDKEYKPSPDEVIGLDINVGKDDK